ncbi:hypothetical protein NPX99_05815 [Bartonella sp. 220]|uniref:hypothetical protein n=1 Tax=Bartonella sp. 220B TaxID=2967260 RepID=UPI0022A92770|nr:hypothetical protein [Bartonella sp. 220B]MCZ2158787.1 hypothetical protein [Bartonella sp. 220B]
MNDAIKFIDQEFIEGMKEVMMVNHFKYNFENFSDFEKDVMNAIRDTIIRNPSDVKKIPSMCKAVKKLHDIMLPNRRKNIINRIGSHIEEWFH